MQTRKDPQLPEILESLSRLEDAARKLPGHTDVIIDLLNALRNKFIKGFADRASRPSPPSE